MQFSVVHAAALRGGGPHRAAPSRPLVLRLDLILRHHLRRLAAAVRVALRFRGGPRRVNLPTHLSLRYALHVLCVLVRGRMRAPVIREALRLGGVVVALLCWVVV